MTDKHYTICLNTAVSHLAYERALQNMRSKSDTEPHWYSLMFLLSKGEYPEDVGMTFRMLARNKTIRELFRFPLYGYIVQLSSCWYLLLSSVPKVIGGLSRAQNQVLLVADEAGHSLEVPCAALHTACLRPEKFSLDCSSCRIQDRGSRKLYVAGGRLECLDHCLQEWLELHPEHATVDLLRSPAAWDGWAADLSLDDLKACLERAGPLLKYAYVDPKYTRNDVLAIPDSKEPPVRLYTDTFLEKVDSNREELSERSRNSARSRKATRICDNECWLSSNCSWRSNNYKCCARECHGVVDPGVYYGALGYSGESGPYPEEEVKELYQRWLRSDFPDRLSNEEISFLVANAGAETRLLTKERMRLAGTDRRMKHALFVFPDAPHSLDKYVKYSFADAKEILNTLYFHEGRYQNDGVLQNFPMLDDQQIALYAEIRQHRYLPTGAGWGRGNRERPIYEVTYTGEGFKMCTRNHHQRRVNSLRDATVVFGLDQTIRSFKFKWRDAEAVVHRESTRGTLP